MALTALLCPDAHLRWTKQHLYLIVKAINKAPLLPVIKQRILLYRAHSKINHTHCLMALSPSAMTEVDSIVEGVTRKIWHLPNNFPRARLRAPTEELGLNIPTIWEDYCRATIRSWIQVLNNGGALGTTARAYLLQAETIFKYWPLELAFHTTKGRATCPSVIGRNVVTLLTADLHPMGDIEIWKGSQIANSIATKIPITMDEDGCPTEGQPFPPPIEILHKLPPLWDHRIHEWG